MCAVILLVVGLVGGCPTREQPIGVSPPILPTAFRSPAAQQGPVARGDQLEATQELIIQVRDRRFGADRYDAQPEPTALRLRTDGRAYTFAINDLAQPQPLDPNGTTTVHLTLPRPGEFTMILSGEGDDTAVLNVRSAGGRERRDRRDSHGVRGVKMHVMGWLRWHR